MEGPGQVEGAHKGADLGRAHIHAAQHGCHRGGGKAQWDAFGEVEQKESRQTAIFGGQQIGESHKVVP